MRIIKKNSTPTISFLVVSSSDHITGVTGLSEGATDFAIFVSENGEAFSADAISSFTITELAYGWYKCVFDDTTYTDTLGELLFHITATGGDPIDFKMMVCEVTLDDVGAPVTVDSSSTVFAILDKLAGSSFSTTTDSLKVLSDNLDTVDGVVDGIDTAVGALNNLSVSEVWGEALPGAYGAGTAGYLIDAIQDKTTNLPADPASTTNVTTSEGVITSAISGLNNISVANIWGEAVPGAYSAGTAGYLVDAINDKTTNLPADPAATSDVSGLNNISVAEVWGEALPGAYGAGTAGYLIDSINDKTTNLPADPASTTDVTTSEGVVTGAISGLNNLSATDVEDAVWDATMTDHEDVGSTGITLSTAGAGGDPSAIADAVWSEDISTYTTPNTAGQMLHDEESIIWDATMASHVLTGSTGKSLSLAGSGTIDYNAIADAVWDEPTAGHDIDDTFGKQASSTVAVDVPPGEHRPCVWGRI
jgi:hypothetical protein